jgi:hypothetical protein
MPAEADFTRVIEELQNELFGIKAALEVLIENEEAKIRAIRGDCKELFSESRSWRILQELRRINNGSSRSAQALSERDKRTAARGAAEEVASIVSAWRSQPGHEYLKRRLAELAARAEGRIFILYDKRAAFGDTSEAQVLGQEDTLSAAMRAARRTPDAVIYSYRSVGSQLLDERKEEIR